MLVSGSSSELESTPSFPRHGTGSSGAGPFRRRLAAALAAAGLVVPAAWGASLVAAVRAQGQAAASWPVGPGRLAAGPLLPPSPNLARPLHGVDFRLRIPRLHYSALVREGVTAGVLFAGPGHYPGTAWPGEPGNVGIAAHSVYWLGLDRLRPGDAIFLDTRYGTFRYRVTGSRIVAAGDSSVLAPAPGRDLTLTTCWWPWAGQFAPSRLVVFATAAPGPGRAG